MLRFFEAPKQGTPKGIIELDSNMLLMKNRIMLNKLTYVGKIMAKSEDINMCRRALLNGRDTCKGKDLLTECENWCQELDIQNVTEGCLDTALIKNAVWAKNEDDIKLLMTNMTKLQDRYSDDRKERDYIKRMSLRDTRIWFRQRSRMTLRIKANRSSVFQGNMGCRYCEEDIRIENQEHLEQCEGFRYEQRGLDLTEEMGKQIFWRRMAPKLKKLDQEDKYAELKEKMKRKKEEQTLKTKTKTKKRVVATKLKKAKQNTKVAEKLKETQRAFAERRKQKVYRTIVLGDDLNITSGQREATPLLHREGLSCAVEVPSTRGSREGEPPPRRLPP